MVQNMQKYFFNVFLAANLSTLPFFAFADESSKNVRSGFFFGIDTGYTIGFERNYESNNQGNQNNLTNTSKISYAPQYLNIGAKFGYNHYFSDRFGIRGYVDYIYGVNSIRNTAITNQTSTTTTGSERLHYINVNIDALINFYTNDIIALGAFAGIGFGYGAMASTATEQSGNVTTTTDIASGFIMPINLGVSLIAGGKHRIDLSVKIPTFSIEQNIIQTGGGGQNQINNSSNYRHIIGMVGYSYTF